jgi:hypothetical protein
LQSTRWSLSQFLLTNINFSKNFDCKQHLLRLVSIPIKENIISISICLLTMFNIWWARKSWQGTWIHVSSTIGTDVLSHSHPLYIF